MVRFLLAALSILVSFIYLWPLAHRAFTVKGVPLTCAGVLAITFGLSTGMLSLYMLALGLLPGDWIRPMMVLPAPWLLFGLGIWRTKRVPSLSSSRQALIFWLTLICAAGFMIIAVNTVSYPFYRYDVLARFAPNARLLFDSRSVPSTLTGYPLGVQMLYTFAFMLYGTVNDHLAGLVVAAFSGAMLLTTFAVGRVVHPIVVEMFGLAGGYHGFWLDGEHAFCSTQEMIVAALAAKANDFDCFIRIPPTGYWHVT